MKKKNHHKNEIGQDQKSYLLVKAVREGNYSAVEALLEKNFPINGGTLTGDTPLLVAVMGGDENNKMVKLLLKNGANPNLPNWAFLSSHPAVPPLQLAAAKGYTDLVRILLNYGADATIQHINKITALDLAIHINHTEIANKLRSAMGIPLPWDAQLKKLLSKCCGCCTRNKIEFDDEKKYI